MALYSSVSVLKVLYISTGYGLQTLLGMFQFSSVQFRGHRGDMRDDSGEILFQSCLQESFVGGFGMGRDVQCLALSIQHFLR